MAAMRADRLVAILMMLQTRGRVTAGEVASELEISERTARRDLEALGMAGLPIYSQQGRGGGWQLIGDATTDLSGLTSAEARALFLVAGPSSSAPPEVKVALRKLVRALPEPFRAHAEAASAAMVVDPSGWGRTPGEREEPPHLEVLQQAVIEGRQIRLGYRKPDGTSSTRVLHPLGIANKARSWYLVAHTEAGLRTFRIDRVTGVDLLADPVDRPEGFDLREAWRLITDRFDRNAATPWAEAHADASIVASLRAMMGDRIRIGPPAGDGRIQVEIAYRTARSLAWDIAGFGRLLEIVEPTETRELLAEIGRQLTDTYDPGAPGA